MNAADTALTTRTDSCGKFNGSCGVPVDGAPRFGACFQAHIEQGPVPEDRGVVIGVVTGALGQRWDHVVLTGLEAHAGPTAMEVPRDALQAALPAMQAVNRMAGAEAPHARGTVGVVQVFPNSRNTIPGRVSFTEGFRHPDDACHDAVRVARTAPTAMVFVPCKDGISHYEVEDARPEHLATACQVLREAMLETARRAA